MGSVSKVCMRLKSWHTDSNESRHERDLIYRNVSIDIFPNEPELLQLKIHWLKPEIEVSTLRSRGARVSSFINRRFPRMLRSRRIACLLSILLILGCGGEDSVHTPVVDSVGDENPLHGVLTSSPYYPTTLGSRWVYRNADGSEWTREIAETEVVNRHKLLLFFSDNPLLEGNEETKQLMFVKAPSYIVTSDKIVHPISLTELHNRLGKTIEIPYKISKSVHGIFNGFEVNTRYGFVGTRTYKIHGFRHSDFTLLASNLAPGATWNALDLKFSVVHDVAPQWFSHSLEAHLEIWAKINANRISIVTPAGTFEDCLEIQYYQKRLEIETKRLSVSVGDRVQAAEFPKVWKEIRKYVEAEIPKTADTEFLKAMPPVQSASLWLTPEVGPVKIKDASGISELIAFDVKRGSNQRVSG